MQTHFLVVLKKKGGPLYSSIDGEMEEGSEDCGMKQPKHSQHLVL